MYNPAILLILYIARNPLHGVESSIKLSVIAYHLTKNPLHGVERERLPEDAKLALKMESITWS